MAVIETIKNLFVPAVPAEPKRIVPAPLTAYYIRPLTTKNLAEVMRLNLRCFRNGDNYTKHTFEYLLNEPKTLSYRIVTPTDELVAFAFIMVNDNNAAHLTTIGVAPEHRRRHLAAMLLKHVEQVLTKRGVSTIMLEVRVGNSTAQRLYRRSNYTVVQRIAKYYNNGEDCFLMMKSLI